MSEPLQNLARKRRKKRAWERAFLKVLAQSGNVTEAAEAAGLTRTSLYEYRERHPDFSQAWDSALETFADSIEQEAIRRAVKGVVRYKFYKGQPVRHPDRCECDHARRSHEQGARCQEEGCRCSHFLGQPYKERERSDALLALLLKGLRPATYRDNLGLSQEEIDAFVEKRIAEEAEARIEARMNQLGIRNGTAPHPPVTARQGNVPPDSTAASPAAGGPAPGPGSQERGPDPSFSEEVPRRPPWLPPAN
jgi:hypothetical protein